MSSLPRGFSRFINGRSERYRPSVLAVYPDLSEAGPPGYELRLSNHQRTSTRIRFTTPLGADTCITRLAAHAHDDGGRAGEPYWFKLHVTDYVEATEGNEGKLSGELSFGWAPLNGVGGTLKDLPVRIGKRGVPMRRCE
ncbi:MAG: hypothetical protein H6718_11260 [Polyangiaceae bacterium]|nr:hypothetical protein [Polyangiaceae bacterium]MCB9607102.1 hypothetical protein [Polyangiaceae bacterium]